MVEPSTEPRNTSSRLAWTCIGISIAIYAIIFFNISDNLFHPHKKLTCHIVNSTITEKQCWSIYNRKIIFEVIWIVDVDSTDLHYIRYLADIRQEFNTYFAAHEAISISYRIGFQNDCYAYPKDKHNIRWTEPFIQKDGLPLFLLGSFIFISLIICWILFLLNIKIHSTS